MQIYFNTSLLFLRMNQFQRLLKDCQTLLVFRPFRMPLQFDQCFKIQHMDFKPMEFYFHYVFN